MTLSELIDLEARLALDAHVADDALRTRDRAIAATLSDVRTERAALVRAWVHALAPKDRMSVGERVRSAFTVLRSALLVLGLLSGASAASAALLYDGTHPVNVAHFLFGLVFPQMALVTLTSLFMLFAHGETPQVMRRLLRAITERTSRDSLVEVAALWGRIDARRGLSTDVERHTLVAVLQIFGIAFNLGALGACLVRVAFTDVRFAWSSTLIAWDGTMTRMVHALALPWARLWPDAAPTAALVHATRFYRGDALPEAEIAGRWWPFLVASLVAYGLLPRLVLLIVAIVKQRRALAHIPLDTPDIDAVVRRLTLPVIAFPQHAPLGPLPLARGVEPSAETRDVRRFVPIAWRGFPFDAAAIHDAVARALGGSLSQPMTLGGPDHAATDQTLATLPSRLDETDAVLLLCEAFDPPDKGLRKMLARVRTAVGPHRTILVGLVDRVHEDGVLEAATADAVATWRRTLDALADPYLRVESIAQEPGR